MKRIVLILWLSICSIGAVAQSLDSLTTRPSKSAKGTRYTNGQYLNSGWLDYHAIDTSIHRLEIYHPLYRNQHFFQDLGNIGTPTAPLVFAGGPASGFQLGFNSFNPYLFRGDSTKYYDTKSPYTDLFYFQGVGELLFLKATHTQSIGPRINFGVDLRRTATDGRYLRQETDIWNTRVFGHYAAPNQRYHLLANINWNRYNAFESGGIISDSLFETTTGNRLVNVSLNSAESRVRNREIQINQNYFFGHAKTIFSETDTSEGYLPNWSISHQFSAERGGYTYEDASPLSSDLYPTIRLDSTLTLDSLHYSYLSNKLTVGNGVYKGSDSSYSSLLFRLGMKHQFVALEQYANQTLRTKRSFNNINIEAHVATNPMLEDQLLSYGLTGHYFLSGYNQEDYLLDGWLGYSSTNWLFKLDFRQQQTAPNYITTRFSGNHFLWDNTFNKTQWQSIGLKASSTLWTRNVHIGIKAHTINDLIYYDEAGLPAQLNEGINVLQARLDKTFNWGKIFLENTVLYQNVSNDAVLRIPELSAMERLYYQTLLFKKALNIQVGLTLFYYSEIAANAYQPATRQFHLQNTTQIGNYPLFDFFVNAQIKRAAIFIKFEHVNDGLNGVAYYATPHYPLPVRSLRVGVTWRFFD